MGSRRSPRTGRGFFGARLARDLPADQRAPQGQAAGAWRESRMVRLALLAVAFLIAACSHTSVRVDSGGAVTTTRSSVSIGYSGHGSAAAWALIGIGLIAAEYGGSAAARERGLSPRATGV